MFYFICKGKYNFYIFKIYLNKIFTYKGIIVLKYN